MSEYSADNTSTISQHSTKSKLNYPSCGASMTPIIEGLTEAEVKNLRHIIKKASNYEELKKSVKEFREYLNQVPTHQLNKWLRLKDCIFTRTYGTVRITKKKKKITAKDIREEREDLIMSYNVIKWFVEVVKMFEQWRVEHAADQPRAYVKNVFTFIENLAKQNQTPTPD
jgi:hypothetical protein